MNAQIEDAFAKKDFAASELSALDDDIHTLEDQLKETHEGDLIVQLVQASKAGRMRATLQGMARRHGDECYALAVAQIARAAVDIAASADTAPTMQAAGTCMAEMMMGELTPQALRSLASSTRVRELLSTHWASRDSSCRMKFKRAQITSQLHLLRLGQQGNGKVDTWHRERLATVGSEWLRALKTAFHHCKTGILGQQFFCVEHSGL